MSKQCGHGKPVGERTDHAALARGAHIAEPRVARLQRETDDKHDRHHDQQAERKALHLAQLREAFKIVGSDRAEGAFARFHHPLIMPVITVRGA